MGVGAVSFAAVKFFSGELGLPFRSYQARTFEALRRRPMRDRQQVEISV